MKTNRTKYKINLLFWGAPSLIRGWPSNHTNIVIWDGLHLFSWDPFVTLVIIMMMMVVMVMVMMMVVLAFTLYKQHPLWGSFVPLRPLPLLSSSNSNSQHPETPNSNSNWTTAETASSNFEGCQDDNDCILGWCWCQTCQDDDDCSLGWCWCQQIVEFTLFITAARHPPLAKPPPKMWARYQIVRPTLYKCKTHTL